MSLILDETFDTGALPVHGSFFIVRTDRPERTPFHRPPEPANSAFQHSHTYSAGSSTTRDDLIELIDDAADQIRIASYLIGDERLCQALEKAAARLRGRVHVIVNLEGRRLSDDPDEAAERRRFEALSAHGVTIRSSPGCHAKFAVFDERVALVHSANFMTRAFDTTGENGVLIRDAVAVAEAARFFERIWRGARWELKSTGTSEIAPRNPEPATFQPAPISSSAGLIWTYHDEHLILDTIKNLIDSAERELVLATFNLSGMSSRPELLHDHLRGAIARGVNIKLLMRAQGGREAGDEAAAVQDLGVQLYPCSLNHAKGIVADGLRGALFSANLDARFGLDRDVELGVRLDGTQALVEALRYFEHAMGEHDRVLIRDPSALTLASGWNTRPFLDASPFEVIASAEAWEPFSGLRSGPVVFQQDLEHLRLFAEDLAWNLSLDPTRQRYVMANTQRQEASVMSLLERRAPPGESVPGICTAVFRLISN